jgi:catechol 2,3-dioxygenase-like lactoylglutathione lyase family enzyme
MNRIVAAFVILSGMFICVLTVEAQTPARPRITGVDHVAFYTTAPEGVKKLYGEVLGLASAAPVEAAGTDRYLVGMQWVGFSAAPDPKLTDRMDHVALTTDNISGMRKYLVANGVKAGQIEGRSDHSLSFSVTDPEGHHLEFVERGKADLIAPPPAAVSHRMIHAGFLVYHREAEDHFYKDLLGFRPYWHGGMHDDRTDWVAMQVPDGTDWVEYMLNQPNPADLHTSGVMNHISLGVVDMKKAQAVLEAHGWKPHGDEKAQMGKDGKWQLNLYDPDLTRVELMEFKPAEKPCCSEFTGEHPSE